MNLCLGCEHYQSVEVEPDYSEQVCVKGRHEEWLLTGCAQFTKRQGN